jgi:hypothetical protein
MSVYSSRPSKVGDHPTNTIETTLLHSTFYCVTPCTEKVLSTKSHSPPYNISTLILSVMVRRSPEDWTQHHFASYKCITRQGWSLSRCLTHYKQNTSFYFLLTGVEAHMTHYFVRLDKPTTWKHNNYQNMHALVHPRIKNRIWRQQDNLTCQNLRLWAPHVGPVCRFKWGSR